jgi:hypothetical protein
MKLRREDQVMSSKQEYYKLLFENSLMNYLDLIEQLSYTQKLNLVKNILKNHSSRSLNLALQDLKGRYIDLGRIQIPMLKNLLIGLVKKYNGK